MESPEFREIKKVVNAHAADIQALTAVVYGLLSQLHADQGEEAIAAAEARATTAASSIGSPFGVRPNMSLIRQVFASAKQPS